VRFAVIDDGPGIPAAERDRVFERFHRTDSSRSRLAGGAGLGLAIVRAIAEAHHGTVRAGASAQGGARIEIDLPGVISADRTNRPTPVRAGAPSPPPR
jgi:two-component system OmpR family sensor kinase